MKITTEVPTVLFFFKQTYEYVTNTRLLTVSGDGYARRYVQGNLLRVFEQYREMTSCVHLVDV